VTIIDNTVVSTPAELDPELEITPGDILNEEFLIPLNISQRRLAEATGISLQQINAIILGKRAITADVAVRLGRALGMSPRFWMNLQADYDLNKAEHTVGTIQRVA
jgi:addiction module HigA family antidote